MQKKIMNEKCLIEKLSIGVIYEIIRKNFIKNFAYCAYVLLYFTKI